MKKLNVLLMIACCVFLNAKGADIPGFIPSYLESTGPSQINEVKWSVFDWNSMSNHQFITLQRRPDGFHLKDAVRLFKEDGIGVDGTKISDEELKYIRFMVAEKILPDVISDRLAAYLSGWRIGVVLSGPVSARQVRKPRRKPPVDIAELERRMVERQRAEELAKEPIAPPRYMTKEEDPTEIIKGLIASYRPAPTSEKKELQIYMKSSSTGSGQWIKLQRRADGFHLKEDGVRSFREDEIGVDGANISSEGLKNIRLIAASVILPDVISDELATYLERNIRIQVVFTGPILTEQVKKQPVDRAQIAIQTAQELVKKPMATRGPVLAEYAGQSSGIRSVFFDAYANARVEQMVDSMKKNNVSNIFDRTGQFTREFEQFMSSFKAAISNLVSTARALNFSKDAYESTILDTFTENREFLTHTGLDRAGQEKFNALVKKTLLEKK